MNAYPVKWFDDLVDNSVAFDVPLLNGQVRTFRGEKDWPPRCWAWAYSNMGVQITSWESMRDDRPNFTSKWINTNLVMLWHKQNKSKCPFCNKKK